MERKEKIILRASLIVISCVLVASIFGSVLSVMQVPTTIRSTGSVRGVGVGIYWDSLCTNKTTSLVWGTIDPGTNKTVTIFVRNEGNVAAILTKTVQNWTPTNAANYLTLNWNYNNQTIAVNKVIQINLILVVASNISGITSFNFDFIITANG